MLRRGNSQPLGIIWEENALTAVFCYQLTQTIFIMHWDFIQEDWYHGVSQALYNHKFQTSFVVYLLSAANITWQGGAFCTNLICHLSLDVSKWTVYHFTITLLRCKSEKQNSPLKEMLLSRWLDVMKWKAHCSVLIQYQLGSKGICRL